MNLTQNGSILTANGPGNSPPGDLTGSEVPCIEVERLGVRYASRLALHQVTLAIRRGTITAVVGPSGCGKSTFLACLNRLTDLVPSCHVTGRIRLDGVDIHLPDTDLQALRCRVGMIFQKPNPFPLSVRDNLGFPLKHHGIRNRREREERMEGILRRVGLWNEVKDRLGAPALGLSGGQQQRLCLARALVLEPEVLLLDEPCSALDPIAGGVVEDLIVSLRGIYTVIIVTHNLAQAKRIADDLAVFWVRDGAGTLIGSGPAGDLFDHPQDPDVAAYIGGRRG